MSSILDRMKAYVSDKGIKYAQIARDTSTPVTTVHSTFKVAKDVSSDFLARFFNAYPNLNKDYFFSGEGTPEKEGGSVVEGYIKTEVVKVYESRIIELEKLTKTLSDRLDQLILDAQMTNEILDDFNEDLEKSTKSKKKKKQAS